MAASKLAIGLVVIAIGVLIWAGDRITLEGEHTVHTVQCLDGKWEERRCTGVLVAGDRYRFRASRSRQEVLYWTAGSREPSGKYTECIVRDRDNWSCKAVPGQPTTIARALVDGKPNDGEMSARSIHIVRKWKWWLLRSGIHFFSTADY